MNILFETGYHRRIIFSVRALEELGIGYDEFPIEGSVSVRQN